MAASGYWWCGKEVYRLLGETLITINQKSVVVIWSCTLYIFRSITLIYISRSPVVLGSSNSRHISKYRFLKFFHQRREENNKNYLIIFRGQTVLQKPKFSYHIQDVNHRGKKMLRLRNYLQDPFRTLTKTWGSIMMMNCFCGMVDLQNAFSLISSWDHCQRSSPSTRIWTCARPEFRLSWMQAV